jgi:iron complex transport system ATP-binding protein
MSLLSVEKVSYSYRNHTHKNRNAVPALDHISFTVEPGEHIALIGPNGSGKTTLFNLLAGFTHPSSGCITLEGAPIRSYGAQERAHYIALVPQGSAITFPYTCLETVLMGLHPYQRLLPPESPQALARAKAIMEQTGVWSLASQGVTAISGGELQRVILARALLQVLPGTGPPSRRVLLLDEAFSSLDIAARIRMMKLLKALQIEHGLTIIGIHHDMPTAFRFTQRIIALSRGVLVADGPPEQVCSEDFFERFFSVQVEILPGKGFLFVDTQDP